MADSARPSRAYAADAARSLARALEHGIEGEVRFGDGDRALYATDASNYRQLPIGVVVPRSVDDVIATVELCRQHEAPILARGGGTSLAGQCCNTAVVLDCSKYLRRIVSLDPDARRAVVEPGCVLDALRDRAEQHHLTFGPDPATHDHNTLGGMIGNNSCGVHALMAGRTADNVIALDVLTYDGTRLRVGATAAAELEDIGRGHGRRGELYRGLAALRDRYAEEIRERFPSIPRRVSGYNLDELLPERGCNVARALVGSEGTCAIVLNAELELIQSPPHRALAVLGFEDVYTAGDRVPDVLEHDPIGLEGFDDVLLEYMRDKHMAARGRSLLPDGRGWLLVEFGGETMDDAAAKARRLIASLERVGSRLDSRLVTDRREQGRIWQIRESGLGATAHLGDAADNWPGWEDAAVPPARLGVYLREFRALLDRFGYDCSLYGHFGDGCLHVRIDFDLATDEGIGRYRAFTAEAADLVVSHGGSLSGEHGDGQARADLLPKMFGDRLVGAFREFKRLWDPENRMNPGKVVDADSRDANLRLPGFDLAAARAETVFAYARDGGSFPRASLRCVGVGTCRRTAGGVMCPSYMATLEEKHSTRGRARLLHEMVRGMEGIGPLRDGWRSDDVREALDLCLACKGCLSDCPVKVDMASYKAEFNHHYYRRRLRPRSAYAMGLIYWWSRIASHAPAAVNAVTGARLTAPTLKRLAGIAAERPLPKFARVTFRRWFARRRGRQAGTQRVMLWPDTFNNYLQPEKLIAAVEVLEALGFEVTLPRRPLCCGRPLYAWGMLDLAKRQLGATLTELSDGPDEVPIVGLEPACVAAFRDELPKLMQSDERAGRLARRVVTLAELLAREEALALPRLGKRALVQVHCNQHAVMGFDCDRAVMRRIGLDYEVLDAGCCGMAGPFGLEAEHYEVSLRIAERALLPAIRRAPPGTLILSDGYACREQIAQGTSRTPLHLAEVLQQAFAAARTGRTSARGQG